MSAASPRGKALPPRPTQDLGNGGQEAYGSTHKENMDPRNSSSATRNARMEPPPASGKTVLEGYRNSIMDGVEEKPRYNPVSVGWLGRMDALQEADGSGQLNPTRPQSSTLLNVNDSIQIHLLVETALGDSKEFEILSQEEVDDLKKQCRILAQRIEQTRQSLTIQTKYRDAANSMAKLYMSSDKKKSFDGQDGTRRSIFGHARNRSDSVKEADQERVASEKKCEDLALELWNLEKRLMDDHSRLLKHTAGILQMTHKGPKKVSKEQEGAQQQGIPGSPESMYTYSNARNSVDQFNDEFFFDERSLYRAADRLDGFGIMGRDDLSSQSTGPSKDLMQMISNTEQKLEDLNSRLREVIIRANPDRETTYSAPPRKGASLDSGATLQSHLEYLERGIVTIDQENGAQSARVQQQSEAAMEQTLQELNNGVRNILLTYNPSRPEPPQLTGNGLNDQLRYFQDIIGAVATELSSASSTATKSAGNQGNLEQMETVMMGLWELIQSGEQDQRQRKADRRRTRTAQNMPDDEDDSPDDDSELNENFTLQGFSSMVQWLYSQATRLKDQKKVLQRQIKQQRELNSKSDETKDAEMAQKVEELRRTQDLLTRTEANAHDVRRQLSDMMEKLEDQNNQHLMREQARSVGESATVKQAQEELNRSNLKLQQIEQELNARTQAIRQVEDELDSRNRTIADLEEKLQDMKDDQAIGNAELQSKIAGSESKIASLTQELAAAATAKALTEQSFEEKQKAIDAKEKEMEDMNMEIAELRTEVTIARAELDGAYGSRAQRAAQVAANPAIQKEIDTLTQRNASLAAEIAVLQNKATVNPESDAKMATLKKELEETIEEFEQMTKASIEWEKERESLEGTIDTLRDERESLEAQLRDEKVRWLGMTSPSHDGTMVPATTSTTVLRNEFKKMMRDTRAESLKALRVRDHSQFPLIYYLVFTG